MTYKICLKSKQSISSFTSNVPKRSRDALEVVNSHICGPFEVPSLGGSRYFTIFVDEHTRMLWLYTISLKSEAFEVFKKFKVLIEKEIGKKIKILRAYRCDEYTLKEFEAYFRNEGIKHEVTSPYRIQHNGLAKSWHSQEHAETQEFATSILGWGSQFYHFYPQKASN